MFKNKQKCHASRRRLGIILCVFCFHTAKDQILLKDVQELGLLSLLLRNSSRGKNKPDIFQNLYADTHRKTLCVCNHTNKLPLGVRGDCLYIPSVSKPRLLSTSEC